MKEIEASHLQARAAASVGDFAAVRGIAGKLADMAEGNIWLTGQSAQMTELSDLEDAALLRKESTYASASLMRSYTATAGAGAEATLFTAKRIRQGKAG